MSLECLILTRDPTLLGHVQSGLAAYGASLQLRQDTASVVEVASRRHLDGLIIDCDDVPGGTEVIGQLRASRANRQTLIVSVLNGLTSPEVAVDLGVDFSINKPIQHNRLRGVLDLAIPRMEREHRRYFRYDVDLPVRFRNPLGQSFNARMQNVSEGGLAIRMMDPVKLKGVVIVEFELPNVAVTLFHAKAEVVWSDSFIMGLRFLFIEKTAEAALHSWLSSLEAQLRFHESAKPS